MTVLDSLGWRWAPDGFVDVTATVDGRQHVVRVPVRSVRLAFDREGLRAVGYAPTGVGLFGGIIKAVKKAGKAAVKGVKKAGRSVARRAGRIARSAKRLGSKALRSASRVYRSGFGKAVFTPLHLAGGATRLVRKTKLGSLVKRVPVAGTAYKLGLAQNRVLGAARRGRLSTRGLASAAGAAGVKVPRSAARAARVVRSARVAAQLKRKQAARAAIRARWGR